MWRTFLCGALSSVFAVAFLVLSAGQGSGKTVPAVAQEDGGLGDRDATFSEPRLRGDAHGRPVDCFGDPLPAGALARVGTVRLRHPNFLAFIAVSPDGRYAVSSGASLRGELSCQAMHFWDLATARELVEVCPSAVGGAAFSPDGRWLAFLAAGAKDLSTYQVLVWEVASRKMTVLGLIPRANNESNQTRLAFSPDKRLLAVAMAPDMVYLWDTARAKRICRWALGNPPFGVMALAFAPDGRKLGCLRGSNVLHLFDVPKRKEGARLRLPSYSGLCWFQFAPSGKEVVYYDLQGVIMWYALASGKETHRTNAKLIAASTDGARIALLDQERIRVWDVESRRQVRAFPVEGQCGYGQYPFAPCCCALGGLSADGCRLVAANGRAIRALDTRTGKDVLRGNGHVGPVNFVAFARKGRELITVADTTIGTWDAQSGKKLASTSLGDVPIACAVLTPDGKTLVALSRERTLFAWDRPRGKDIWRKAVLPWRIVFPQVYLSVDGQRVMLKTQEENGLGVRCWDIATGRQVARFFYPGPQTSFFFADDRAALGFVESHFLKDPVRGTSIRDFEAVCAFGGEPCAVTWSPDGKLVATSLRDRRPLANRGRCVVALWEAASGKIITLFKGHRGAVSALAFSTDGRLLASGSWDGTIRLWSVVSGKELACFDGIGAGITALAFSADDKRLASGNADTTGLVWDVASCGSPLPRAILSQEKMHKLWTALLSEDVSAAYPAIWQLVAAAEQSVPYLRSHLPEAVATRARIKQLIGDLDDERFERRQGASRQLAGFGPEIVPELREVLKSQLSPEARRRLTAIVKRPEPAEGSVPPQELRRLRALQVLEYIGTGGAIDFLQVLSHDEVAPGLGKMAQQCCQRLMKRTGP
jgi:WD40 repeat protein